MKYIFTILSLFFFAQSQAQSVITVKGAVKGGDGKALPNASVMLYYPGEKDTLKTVTNAKGEYRFFNARARNLGIIISYIGYKKFNDTYNFSSAQGEAEVGEVVMTPGDNLLETVTVESSRIQIKEDTVSYKIDSTMYRKNDNVEQVLKQLPGVQVDKDGKVTAQGKEVTKVKVNGKEFFGGDVKTATRELNADMVDKIQIVDDYGDQAAFTGVKDGDPTKTLNIQLKKDKNKGYFGNVTAGGGTEDRYLGSVSINRFNNSQQISVYGNINNTNASLFNFSGLPGGMGAMAGSMVRSFGGGGGSPFAGIGNNDGVGVAKSFGANYREDLSKKVSVYGSYSFSEKNNTILNNINQQLLRGDSTYPNQQSTRDNSITDNHRFSFNVEYKIDSFNYVKITPGITYRKVRDDYRSDNTYYDPKGGIISSGFNTDANHSTAPNFTGNVLFNHRFKKKGRTLSLNFTGATSSVDNEDVNYSDNLVNFFGVAKDSIINQNIIQDNRNHNYGMTASFNEQLSKTHSLEFNYAFNKRFTGNDKLVYNLLNGNNNLIDTLTNEYQNDYTTNRFGANFRTTTKKYNYSIGMAVQPATIESNSFTTKQQSYTQNIVNYYPVVRFAYNFSKSKSFNLNYNGSTSQPTYQQLQPVYDYSNVQNIVVGNPDLKPEFSNTFSMRYNNFNFVSGNVFFGNLSASLVKDKIVSNILSRGAFQETRYLNADGYYNVNGFYAVSKPIQNRKYVFNLTGTVNYNNNISYLNYIKNKGRNWIVSQRFSMDYKLKKWLETSGGANFTINDAKYSLTPRSNSSIRTWSLTHSFRIFFPHDFILSYDLDKTINSGYAGNVDANPLLINSTLEKQFLKKKNASFKLQAFDLLNENTNVNRTVTGSSITDTRTNRLQRYFMLSFVFRFSKFAGSTAGPAMPMQGGQGMKMMMGGPGM
jgi:hypothetical protein